MKIVKWLLIVLVIIALLAAGFLAYLGYFSSPNVREAKMGPYTIVYESFTGPYAQTGPVFARVHKAVTAAGIKAGQGLGIYYDDPSKVPAGKLRSDCGVVIGAKDLRKARALKQFKVKRLPASRCAVAEFPIRNTLSYMIGPMKAYPALMKYLQEKNYKMAAAYELYDEGHKKIFFVFALAE
ncbi:MAG: GyrI-like domain-containing protein [Candidatus Saganbacteria bacterium]|nr:GyrI-like domain-containing protein [Candidatus Saganbacteria bacterium]